MTQEVEKLYQDKLKMINSGVFGLDEGQVKEVCIKAYNLGVQMSADNAVTIFDTGLVNEIMLKSGKTMQYTDNDLIYKPSILKLLIK